MWTVEAVLWEFRKHASEHERVLAKKGESPGVQLGEGLDAAEVPDRGLAVALAHYFLDKHAEKAVGLMSLEIHVHPPEQDVEDESQYQVSGDVLEQARKLGIEGDIEGQVRRMARDATPYTHERANLRLGQFILRVEGTAVTWLGRLADPPSGRRKAR